MQTFRLHLRPQTVAAAQTHVEKARQFSHSGLILLIWLSKIPELKGNDMLGTIKPYRRVVRHRILDVISP